MVVWSVFTLPRTLDVCAKIRIICQQKLFINIFLLSRLPLIHYRCDYVYAEWVYNVYNPATLSLLSRCSKKKKTVTLCMEIIFFSFIVHLCTEHVLYVCTRASIFIFLILNVRKNYPSNIIIFRRRRRCGI